MGSGTIVTNSAKGILDYADNENSTVIITATHGMTGINLWTLVIVVDKILHEGSIPLPIVKK